MKPTKIDILRAFALPPMLLGLITGLFLFPVVIFCYAAFNLVRDSWNWIEADTKNINQS